MAEVEANPEAQSNEPDYKRLHAYSLVRNTGNVCWRQYPIYTLVLYSYFEANTYNMHDNNRENLVGRTSFRVDYPTFLLTYLLPQCYADFN